MSRIIITLVHAYQVNTLSGNWTADTIATYDGFLSATSPCIFGFMYLAGDNKIYISSFNYGIHVHCINYPDSLGTACDLQQHIIQLPCYHLRSVPNHPNYFLGQKAAPKLM